MRPVVVVDLVTSVVVVDLVLLQVLLVVVEVEVQAILAALPVQQIQRAAVLLRQIQPTPTVVVREMAVVAGLHLAQGDRAQPAL